MNPIRERQCAHFIYTKKKLNVYIYIQKARHLTKIKTIYVTFLFTKSHTLYVTQFFIKVLSLAFIYIQNAWYFALRGVFIYKKQDSSKKTRQFVLFFEIQKAWHFALRDFSLNFWNWRRGGGHFYKQKNSLCVKFLYAKTMYFPLRFYIQQDRHFASHFYMQKQCTLRYVFISKVYCIVYSDT